MRIRSCRLDPGLRRRCRRAIPLASLSASSASPPSGFDHLISGPTVEIRKPASSSTITSGRPVTQTFERLTGDFRNRPVAKAGHEILRVHHRLIRERCCPCERCAGTLTDPSGSKGGWGFCRTRLGAYRPPSLLLGWPVLKRCQLPSPSDAFIGTRTPDLAPAR